jgi:Alpha-N-acetylglucosaminidase (NAGLU) C-terminal domain
MNRVHAESVILCSRWCRYDPAAVAGAWGQLLSGADALAGESTYLYDLADVGRQVQALSSRLSWSVNHLCKALPAHGWS